MNATWTTHVLPRSCYCAALAVALLAAGAAGQAPAPDVLAGSRPLTVQGDNSVRMRAGFDRFLSARLARSVEDRQRAWHRDFSSAESYQRSVEPNRARLRRIVGVVDPRVPSPALQYISASPSGALVASAPTFKVYTVRWPVLNGVTGEGLLLQPNGNAVARVVALPDAGQTPEMIAGLAPGVAREKQFARTLVRRGCQVLVPVLIDRSDTWSGDARVVMTNIPHREWVYKQAYAVGRHIIGYEVEKVLAGVDWFTADRGATGKIGVAGYGEGGLIAFYAAAVDPRIDAALVSGYFDSRQHVYDEPLYRNIFGLLAEFGDAEIASLVAPRKLVVEQSEGPRVSGPPEPGKDRRYSAAPGQLGTPAFESVQAEVRRARSLTGNSGLGSFIQLVAGSNGSPVGPGSPRAISAFLGALDAGERHEPRAASHERKDTRPRFDAAERLHRQLNELTAYTQKLGRESKREREEFWRKAQPASAETWDADAQWYRDYAQDRILGRITDPRLPPNPRTRKVQETPDWVAYEVVLDVWPDVMDWGYLLVPRGIRPGERRPVVVCQHGLESLPSDTFNAQPHTMAFDLYHNYAARLAEQGFITYAPHNFYRGDNAFRQLQRKANPLGLTLWAITIGQHEQLLDWLASLPFVNSDRIAFYGLSYGGATAMYVPPFVKRYSAVICSGNFTELIRKTVSVDNNYSLVYYKTYEAAEFDMADKFGYAELAALIAPRPFMVERGHFDTVSPDEWIGYEFARVRRVYDLLGIPERARVEFFYGPHTIHGVGTFAFLHRYLNWPHARPAAGHSGGEQ